MMALMDEGNKVSLSHMVSLSTLRTGLTRKGPDGCVHQYERNLFAIACSLHGHGMDPQHGTSACTDEPQLTQKRVDAEAKSIGEMVSKISLVDLAGSERQSSSGATVR